MLMLYKTFYLLALPCQSEMPSKQVTDNDNAVYTTSNGAPVGRPNAAQKISLHGPLLLQGPCRFSWSALLA